uniref:Ribosomal protein S8 n=1 Tax=Saltugilia australis TaxID=40768 RepID=A0A141SBU3_9ERIC|nr:ribosomal protein S8 [Saltugilia australis]
MSRDTIADIITSIRNADMNRKRVVRIPSTGGEILCYIW